MAVTYEEARERLRAEVQPGWQLGTFCLDDRNIVENDELYSFNIGAREWIVDGDDDYLMEGAVPLVRKADGAILWQPSVKVAMDPTFQTRPNPQPTFRA